MNRSNGDIGVLMAILGLPAWLIAALWPLWLTRPAYGYEFGGSSLPAPLPGDWDGTGSDNDMCIGNLCRTATGA